MIDSIEVKTSVEVFCSYSHRDEELRKQFEAHVALMQRKSLIQVWHDRQILAGDDWGGGIDSHLNSADPETSHPHGQRSLEASARGGSHRCESASGRYQCYPRRRGTGRRERWPRCSRYFLMNSPSAYVQ